MKDSLKKGYGFIGQDDEKYYFLGYGNSGQIYFTTENLWCDVEPSFIEKTTSFVKTPTGDKSKIIEHCTWYYQSLKELEFSSLEEKISRCLDIINNSQTDDITLTPLSFGPLVKGQAYNYENNQFYELIGFIVNNEVCVDGEDSNIQKGFFAIYHSNCDETMPMIFERPIDEEHNVWNAKSFLDSSNNIIDIQCQLVSMKEVSTIDFKTLGEDSSFELS